MNRYRLGHIGEMGMAADPEGPWVRYQDAAARIAELEEQLAAERERNALWIPVDEYICAGQEYALFMRNSKLPKEADQ